MFSFKSSVIATALLLAAPALHAQRQLEALDRGVIALRPTSGEAFISWRLLGDDPPDTAFNLYRSSNGGPPEKLNPTPLSSPTHFTDQPDFSAALTYAVRPVVNGTELAADGSFSLPASAPVRSYLEIPLDIPPGGTSPDGTTYTYIANDASAADLDGDGQLDFILRWEPTNSWGGGTGGHTGPVILDAYKLDGTRLWRINLGHNINASAHITVFLVYDFDGNGKAEVACMTADGTIDGAGNPIGDPAADHRNSGGVVLVGPEYLTVFNGETGAALATTLFIPQRHPDTLYPTPAQIEAIWGDGYGNRVNRFLGGVAYLDGKRPSIIMSRGYYGRSIIAAWDWRAGQLASRWVFDSDTPGNAAYGGQGNHNLSIADVDQDGFDEIIYGSCTINHDGTGLYTTGLHHGDALHVADMDPGRPGLEVFAIHESPGSNGGIGTSFRDARTGTVLWSSPATSDVGRGVAFDIDPAHPGFEAWASNSSSLFAANGQLVATTRPSSYNFGLWWDGQPTRELLDQTRIDRWNPATRTLNRLLTASGVSSNNGTKATPCLSGDLLGDWREEVVWRTSDNSALRIHSTIIPTAIRLTTLLHDPQYRTAIAWQNGGYNQPPHPSFFLGHDMIDPPRAPVWRDGLSWRGISSAWSAAGNWLDPAENPATFSPGDRVLLDLTGSAATQITIPPATAPAEVVVHTPETVPYTLDGGLTGPMPLTKAGHGALTLSGNHTFTGPTRVQQGSLHVNGTLAASPVTVEGHATIGGSGTLGAGLTLRRHARLDPGPEPYQSGTLTINGTLALADTTLLFDLGASSADLIQVNGPLIFAGTSTIAFRFPDGPLAPGTYPLIQFTGPLTGGTSNWKPGGLAGTPATLELQNGTLALVVNPTRPPAQVSWSGSGTIWDLNQSESWLLGGEATRFVTNDQVSFDDLGSSAPDVTLADELYPASVAVSGGTDFTLSGPGSIHGPGGLAKSGGGTLRIDTTHSFTGPVSITGGSVEITTLSLAGAPGPLGAGTTAISLADGTLRAAGPFSSTDRPFFLGGSAAAFHVALAAATLVLSGDLSGPAPLVKSGPGTLSLSGNNSHSAGISILAGTLSMGSSAALGPSTVTLSGGTLAMSSFAPPNPIHVTENSTISGGSGGGTHGVRNISGSGTLTLNTTSVFDLEGSLTSFTGRIALAGSGSFRLFGSGGSAAADFDLGTRSLNPRSGTTFQFGSLSGAAGSVLSGAGGYTANVTHTIGANGKDSTFAGTIADGSGGTTSIVKTGGGTLTLTGNSTHTGATTVSGGTLRINGSNTGSNITIQSGAAIGGTGTLTGNLTLNTGAVLEHGPAPLALTGNLNLGSTLVVRSTGAPVPGTHTVLTYTGTLTGNPALTWQPPPGTLFEGTFSLAANGLITLTITPPPRTPGPVTWTGAESTVWDLAAANWEYELGPTTYLENDHVSFLDSGTGNPITIAGDVAPASVTVDATKEHTITGAGLITGAATLHKAGSGTLTLTGVHTYDGGSIITGGTLAITQTGSGGSAVGARAGTGPITLSGNGTFRMGSGNGRNFPSNPIAITAGESGALSSVNLANAWSGTLSGPAGSTLTLDGPVSMSATGSAQFGGFTGSVIIPSGSQLRFSSTSGPNGNGGPAANFHIDGLLNSRNSSGAGGVLLGALTGAGTLQGQTTTPSGTVTYHIGSREVDSTFHGALVNGSNGVTALRKTGPATLTLAGNSTHTGATTVASGTLLVTGSLGNTTLTVEPSGTLGGSGTIAGPATCHGALVPGTQGPGTLAFGNGLTLASTATLLCDLGPSSDFIQVTGPLILHGSLQLIPAPGLTPGSYTLASSTGQLTDQGLTLAATPPGFTARLETTANSLRLILEPVLTAFEQWQIEHFGSTGHPDAAPDADPDHDGTSNLAEFRLGLDPEDPASTFRATLAGTTLVWPSAPGLIFNVKRSLTLDDGWQTVATIVGPPDVSIATWTDPASLSRAFYQIEFTP
jgi:autotransporter-associated beta strand protein